MHLKWVFLRSRCEKSFSKIPEHYASTDGTIRLVSGVHSSFVKRIGIMYIRGICSPNSGQVPKLSHRNLFFIIFSVISILIFIECRQVPIKDDTKIRTTKIDWDCTEIEGVVVTFRSENPVEGTEASLKISILLTENMNGRYNEIFKCHYQSHYR